MENTIKNIITDERTLRRMLNLPGNPKYVAIFERSILGIKYPRQAENVEDVKFVLPVNEFINILEELFPKEVKAVREAQKKEHDERWAKLNSYGVTEENLWSYDVKLLYKKGDMNLYNLVLAEQNRTRNIHNYAEFIKFKNDPRVPADCRNYTFFKKFFMKALKKSRGDFEDAVERAMDSEEFASRFADDNTKFC